MSKINCVGWIGGGGAYVAYTMGAGMLPPPPPSTHTLNFWTWETVFLALLFFGAFGFAFFRGGMAVLYN
jgi:hypothetical protein